MNKVMLTGRMVRDPELRRTKTNKDFLPFTVAATNRGYPTFVDCCAWDTDAVNIAKYFRKGSRISLLGRLDNTEYETKAGKVKKLEVVVEEWEFGTTVGGKSEERESAPSPSLNSSPEEEETNTEFETSTEISGDDLPF